MGSFLNGKNIEDETIEESKINGGFPPGGGTSITNINDINNILKDTPIRDLSTYDTLNTNIFWQPLTTIPHNSPPDNIPFFSYWSYKIDICTSDGLGNFTDFANHQTHDFGRDRGTTANIAIANPEIIGVRNFRVYYEMDSYPITGSPYRTEYKQGSFEIAPELIG